MFTVTDHWCRKAKFVHLSLLAVGDFLTYVIGRGKEDSVLQISLVTGTHLLSCIS